MSDSTRHTGTVSFTGELRILIYRAGEDYFALWPTADAWDWIPRDALDAVRTLIERSRRAKDETGSLAAR
jgi:hypothetical protein